MSQSHQSKRQKTDIVEQARTQLGHAFEQIKQHQPSLLLVVMSLQNLILVFVQQHWMFDGSWQAIHISVNEDQENPCLRERFSRMSPDEINNILNALYAVDPRMYQLLKDLMTGEESDETTWIEWLRTQCKNIPSPYRLKQLKYPIKLKSTHHEILLSHRPRAPQPLSQEDCNVLHRLYHQSEYDPKTKFPIPKSGLQKVMDAMSDVEVVQILDILSGINFSLYESFKRMMTNQESVDDHRVYDQVVRQFPTQP